MTLTFPIEFPPQPCLYCHQEVEVADARPVTYEDNKLRGFCHPECEPA